MEQKETAGLDAARRLCGSFTNSDQAILLLEELDADTVQSYPDLIL